MHAYVQSPTTPASVSTDSTARLGAAIIEQTLARLTLLRLLVDTYTMFPPLVLSLSTRVRALGTAVEVYKAISNPGGKAIVSKGRLNVCAATCSDKLSTKMQARQHTDLLSEAIVWALPWRRPGLD